MINIKVSGITSLKQLKQLDGLDIEFAGFHFDPSSPRYVKELISGEEMSAADYDIKKTGIFTNASYATMLEAVEEYGLDAVQLNGNEPASLCEQLSADTEVIKAFAVGAGKESLDELVEEYDEVCDYYLFTGIGAGGLAADNAFDWKKLAKSKIEKPFFLGGGISPEDGARLKTVKHIDFYGVDLDTLFEKAAGEKDMVAILQFKQSLRGAK